MGISDVTAVFSRSFVVGFFLPAFAALIVYSQTVTKHLLPPVYERYSAGTQLAILGGSALLLGLLLLGLNYPIVRAVEGYPLITVATWFEAPQRSRIMCFAGRPVTKTLGRLLERQAKRRQELRDLRDKSNDDSIKAVAAWQLDRRFPRRRKDLLPTSFGNVVRAFELHSSHRWGLDGIAVHPRIAALLSEKEHELQADAFADAAFFLNLALLATFVGTALLIDLVAFRSPPWYGVLPYFLAFIVAWGFYRAAVGAAARWGTVVRSTLDLHRLELYEKIGIRQPITFEEERLVIGPAVIRCFLHGNRLPDELRAKPLRASAEEE
jgi:hypothetical protein